MPGIRELLVGHVLPGALCLLLLAAGAWLARRGRRTDAIAPIAIGVSFTIGYYLLHPVRSFPPRDQGGWLVFFTPALALIAAADSVVRVPLKIRAAIVEILAATVALLLLVPLSNPSVAASRSAVAVVSLIIWVTWISLERLSLRRGPREMSVVLLLIAVANAVVIGTSGSVIYGLQAGTLVAVTVALLVACLVFRNQTIHRGVIFLFVFIWLGLLINGHFWSNVTMRDAAVLLVAPLLGWLGEIPVLRGDRWWNVMVRVGLVAAPLAILIVVVGIQFRKEMEEFL